MFAFYSSQNFFSYCEVLKSSFKIRKTILAFNKPKQRNNATILYHKLGARGITESFLFALSNLGFDMMKLGIT